jgi:hypothetical protein
MISLGFYRCSWLVASCKPQDRDANFSAITLTWQMVLVIGFVVGFMERLVPDLLEKRNSQGNGGNSAGGGAGTGAGAHS